MVLALLLFGVTACAPPELASRGDKVPQPPSVAPQATGGLPPGFSPRATPPASAVPTPFPEYTAVDCAGRPGKAQVIAAVRRATAIDAQDAITGPMCAGTWQYTLLSVPGHEPVKALTRTTSDGLVLVAAGTDVCSLDIQHQAPSGIYAAASC